jgi:phosphatidylinositol phospholipase C beta
VLKTYVPDGLSDFVDALNNPKEFLTKEEKRIRQLKDKLGIDEKEISVIGGQKSFKLGSSSASSAAFNSGDSSKFKSSLNSDVGSSLHASASAATMSTLTNAAGFSAGSSTNTVVVAGGGIVSGGAMIEKITRDTLKVTKGFQKLLKKQAKENEALKKKQNKERALMQKQHSAAIDKMAANYDKSVVNCVGANNSTIINSVVNGGSNNPAGQFSNIDTTTGDMNEINYKSKLKEMVDEQSRLWANLIERQQSEEKQLNNEHVEQQCVNFQQLLQDAQKQRKKDIESRQKK